MKLIKSLTMTLCAVALLATLSLARAEDKPVAKKPCCDATTAAEMKCEHKCCQKAADAGKICKKCHPDAKADAKKP